MASSRQKDTENLKLNVYQLSDLLLTRAKKFLSDKQFKRKNFCKDKLSQSWKNYFFAVCLQKKCHFMGFLGVFIVRVYILGVYLSRVCFSGVCLLEVCLSWVCLSEVCLSWVCLQEFLLFKNLPFRSLSFIKL